MTDNAAYVHCPVLLALAGAHGHEPIHSALEVTFNQSGRIAWRGANANGYQIRSMVGEVDVMITSTIMYFIWNSGYIEAEAQSGRKVIAIEDRPTFAYVLPPGTHVGFRLKEVGENHNCLSSWSAIFFWAPQVLNILRASTSAKRGTTGIR